MSELLSSFTRFTSIKRDFWEEFLYFSEPVENRDLLPSSRHRANFRQIWEGEEAVFVDLAKGPSGYVLRDFEAVVTGKGHGHPAMELITDIADFTKARLDLRAFPKYTFESDEPKPVIPEHKLVSFYETHDFFRRSPESELAPLMFRLPQR